MKVFNMKKMKAILLSGAMALLAAASLTLGVSLMKPVNANAATLLPTDYRTDGASVRVLTKNDEGAYEEATKQGIRFHVEMGAGYTVNNTVLFDTETTNNNGSYKIADGYKTYTLAIPTRLLNGDLTVNTAKVRKIDTTKYWFTDANGNWESVAYIHNFPVEYYTDALSFRGIICKVEGDTETVIASTDIAERSLTWVAKQAYLDTIDENTNYWGTEKDDEQAAPIIKRYIPTYTVNYGAGVTEEVMWGDKLTKAEAGKTYYDETSHEPVEIDLPLTYAQSTEIDIKETKEDKFVLTGVQYTAEGFKVFTTLPANVFTDGTMLETSALDMVTGAGKTITARFVKVNIDGTGDGARALLSIGFDYSDISYGTHLTILKSSHFYNNGFLYELEEDYEFVFYNQAWELNLGAIALGDIDNIVNYTETVNGETEKNIRITFRNDIMVNGAVTISTVNGGGVTITRVDGTVENITDGYYYWNQGKNMILEIPGEVNLWGENDGDILTIKAGTRFYQNNGFYEVKSDIVVTFNGGAGNHGEWWFEPDEFVAKAQHFTSARTIQEGDDIYIDLTMTNSFADKTVNVVCNEGEITYHNTDNVTSYVPSKIDFHGENGNKILRIHIDAKSVMGDWVTIPKGTELWMNNWVVYIREDLTFYYVAKDGGAWVMNPEFNEVNRSDFVSIGWYENNIRYKTSDVWSTAANNQVVMDDTYIDGAGVIVKGSVYSSFYYYGGSNNLLEMKGVNFTQGGSAILKEGVIFWLFSNADGSFKGAYKLTEDIMIEVSGTNGSQIYKDIELASISSANIASVTNDGANNGEIRFNLNGMLVANTYGGGTLEGSATLNGVATTTGYVYGGDGTSGYTGNTIIAFTGTGFGKAFQATNPSDRVVIEAGTKLWLNSGAGYVTIADTWDYTWTGTQYIPTVPADTKYTVTVNASNATVNFLTSATVSVGDSVTFEVTANEGFAITGISGAVANVDGTYTVSNIYGNVTVNVQVAVRLDASSIERFYTYNVANDFVGIRVQLKNIETLKLIPYKGGDLVTGTVELRVGGNLVDCTKLQSYGPDNLLLGFGCDQVANMVDGDGMTIKAGTIIKYGDVEMYVAEDISCMVKGNGFVQTGVEHTISFNTTNASITENGTTVTSIKVMAGEDATFSVVADSGYAVASVVGATKNDDDTYTVKEVYANATVTVMAVKIVNISQADVISVANEGGTELRIALNKEREDISAITGGNYDIKFNGTVALTINGQSATPTQYNYYGVIDSTNHQLLGIECDFTNIKAGDSLTIKAGSSFTFAGGKIYVDSDIKIITVTVTYNEGATAVNGIRLLNATIPESVLMQNNESRFVLAGSESTLILNWKDKMDESYGLKSVVVTGGEAVDDKNEKFTATEPMTVAYTVAKLYTVTWSATNASITSNDGLTSGAKVLDGTKLSFTIKANSGYSGVNVTNASNTSGDTYTATVNGKDLNITASGKSGGCFVEGTLVTLADGTKKAVENLNMGDELLVFNHETGNYDVAPLIVMTHATAEAEIFTVVDLEFSLMDTPLFPPLGYTPRGSRGSCP